MTKRRSYGPKKRRNVLALRSEERRGDAALRRLAKSEPARPETEPAK